MNLPVASSRRRRGVSVAALVVAVVVGGIGALAWHAGLFTSNGRFDGLDACTLLPPPRAMASLVLNGAREKGDSRPKTWLGTRRGGDLASQCKWSSVPSGVDRPFRTVRIHAQTVFRRQRTSAETQADRKLADWREAASRRGGGPVQPVEVGEEGYAKTDVMRFDLLVSRVNIYDLHVKFRVSNALLDVSARTHSEPGPAERALVLELARTVAASLP